MAYSNNFGQSVGEDLGSWTPPLAPEHSALNGQYVRLEPLQRTQHAIPLFHTFKHVDESVWTYMSAGPFQDAAELGHIFEGFNKAKDVLPYVVTIDNNFHGFMSYLRMQPSVGVIEIGWITFAPSMQRTRASTEAVFLLLDHAFRSGYRRVEWKCDSLNQPSRNAAERLGFVYEGIFRKATHYKGRNRDTAWFAMTDDDWPVVSRRIRTWLDPMNFDENGQQHRPLGSLL